MPSMDTAVVVITGGTAGVGRATARAFADRGARVAVLARGRERLEETRRELQQAGARACALEVDVADADAVERAAATVEGELGPIDVWVNNAMTAVLATVEDTSAEEFRRVTEVTYLGTVHGTLAALRRMRPRDRGTIVQVGSALAYRSIPLQATYCAAKHAMAGFTSSLRTELLAEGSAVNLTMVHLPGLNTPQFSWVRARVRGHPRPVAPVYQPEVAADAIVWAAEHPHRRELLVGWPTVATIWGHKLAPGLLDRYLARTNIQAQQMDEPLEAGRPDYVDAPVPGSFSAHGRFDDESHAASRQLWLTTHRWQVLGTAAAGIGLAARRRRR